MTGDTWNVLYRGPLTSCNYACAYCPFAKTANTREELGADAIVLDRFVGWVAEQSDRRVGVLFTPWGEALVHRHYQQAMLRLAGPGLRDFLRIARANPELWAGILLRNRQRVAEELARFEKNLGEIVEALGRADRESLERVLREGAQALDEWKK